MKTAVLALAALLALAGCAKHEDRPASTLTEAQRDTVLANSQIPGASAVGYAMQAAGREARRASAMDTLGR
jgi:hypothetical protein